MELRERGERNEGFCHDDNVDAVGRSRQTEDSGMMNDNAKRLDVAIENGSELKNGTITARDDFGVEIEIEEPPPLIYKISDSPPISLTIFFAFQQCLLSIAGTIIAPLLVAEAACALDNGVLIRKLVSSSCIMNGITTLLQNLIGVRLPVFQGPSASYVAPLIAMNQIDKTRCDVHHFYLEKYGAEFNSSISNATLQEQLIDTRLREMMGPLIFVGLIHCLVGATGLVGVMMRFIGPITIVPTILLIGLYLVKPAINYTESHWGIAFMTWAMSIILSLYLGHKSMPIPMWTRKRGFRIIRYPLHQVLAILISILIGWSSCAIMTYAGYFTDDKTDKQYKARTDARADTLANSEWFYVPYPGQFGSPLFGVSCLVGFITATITSILDSIGDYYASAAMCRVPPPPRHAMNRGIAVEGFCTVLAGALGAGHATTTYGGNIGAIGMTKVASRSVFVAMSIMYIGFGVLAKVMAVFISIPFPVLGGSVVTILGVFVGVNLSNLKVIDLGSTRNLSIIGTAVFTGLLVPTWMEKNGDAINTGNREVDQVLLMLLGNPNFVGCFLACFLDNTVPGTDEERGIAAWRIADTPDVDTKSTTKHLEGPEVYDIYLPKCLKRQRWLRYIPMCKKNEN